MKNRSFRRVTVILTILVMLLNSFMSIPLSVVAETGDKYQPEPINLALNANVDKSSHWGSGGPAPSAVDGDLTTFWRNHSSDTIHPWLIIDLGQPSLFNQIDLITYIKPGSTNGIPNEMKSFKLEYSNDRENWVEIPITIDKPIVDKADFSFTFTPVEARFVRFTHELGSPGQTNGLYEIAIYKPYIEVELLELNRKIVSLQPGETTNLRTIVTPENADQLIIWQSSDDSVASIDENGIVTANGLGEATITALNDYNKISASAIINVISESNSSKAITEFSFKAADNPVLEEDVVASIDENEKRITIVVPDIYLNQLIPTFETTGIGVGIDGIEITSSETVIDFSSQVILEVYGEDHSIEEYVVDLIVDSSGRDLAYLKYAYIDHKQNGEYGPELAVDGDLTTPYKSNGNEYNKENPQPIHWTVDLGTKYVFDRVKLNLYNAKNVEYYIIQYSNDGENWIDAKRVEAEIVYPEGDRPIGQFNPDQYVIFDEPVVARYVRYVQKLIPHINENLVGGLNNFSVYNGEPLPDLISATLQLSDGTEIKEQGDIRLLSLDDMVKFTVHGLFSDDSEEKLTNVEFKLDEEDSVEINKNGDSYTITPKSFDLVKITTIVTYGPEIGPKTATFDFFVDIVDPETLVMDLKLLNHNDRPFEIGVPAVINFKEKSPKISIYSYFDGRIEGNVELAGKEVKTFGRAVKANKEQVINLSNDLPKNLGTYKINLTLKRDGKPDHTESLFFTVVDPSKMKENESYVAYLGEDGKLVYTPDYRGNNIIDFSNSGYMGGGVAIPSNIPVKEVVKPVEGDNTANIQAAIDRVSALPLDENGFRGVVLLEEGIYEISGVLKIEASGVVLRGSGQGSNGTILYATGSKRSFLLEVGAGSIKELDVSTRVSDHYVPVGARSFSVDDASQFNVGDTIKVKRMGNERWIHEIDMDQIPVIPNSTVQWSPFELMMDRTITDINLDTNTITIDSPITNAIETRWGGAEIVKTEDTRIDNIGVENLMVDVDVNWDKEKIDRYGFRYSENEDQIQSFVKLSNVKDSWVRNVTAYHLIYALVNAFENSQRITIQDSNIYEMSGIITGSRRYGINADGQDILVNRVHIETARHSYTVQARKAGPRVFLDSTGWFEHTNSEPHQRWSTAGLFDNVHGNITMKDRGNMGTGHGWAGANYAAWNTKGFMEAMKAPTATQYVIGGKGTLKEVPKEKEAFVDSWGQHVEPRSLYLQQLQDRLGVEAVENTYNVSATLTGIESVKPNEEFVLTFGLQGADDVSAQEITLAYDYDALDFIKVESIIDGIEILDVDTNTEGKINILLASLGKENAIDGNANILKLTFKAKDVEDDLVRILIEEAELGQGEDGNVVQATVDRLIVTISELNVEQPGDPDDDPAENPVEDSDGGPKEDPRTISITPIEKDNQFIVDAEQLNELYEDALVVVKIKDQEIVTVKLTTEVIEKLKENNATLEITNEVVRLQFAATVLPDGDVTIDIKEVSLHDKTALVVYDFIITSNGKEYHQFDETINLTFTIDSNLVKDPRNVKVFYYNEAIGKWELLGGEYDGHQITVSTDHFSVFGVFETEGTPTVDPNGTSGPGNNNHQNSDTDDVANKEDPESNDNQVTESENQGEKDPQGADLPNTATNTFNILLIGCILLIVAAVCFIYNRKSESA